MKEIRIARKKKKLTQEQLGKLVGVSEATISKYEVGTREPDNDMLLRLAEVLGVSVMYLLTGEEENPFPFSSGELQLIRNPHRQRVPLIGKVAAGTPIMAETDYETFVDTPVDCDVALEIKGESMMPTYLPGDIVYIKHARHVEEGQVAVVLVDDDATLKHVYHNPQGLTLVSDNPAFPPIYVIGKDHEYIAIYGVPVGYTRVYRQKGEF